MVVVADRVVPHAREVGGEDGLVAGRYVRPLADVHAVESLRHVGHVLELEVPSPAHHAPVTASRCVGAAQRGEIKRRTGADPSKRGYRNPSFAGGRLPLRARTVLDAPGQRDVIPERVFHSRRERGTARRHDAKRERVAVPGPVVLNQHRHRRMECDPQTARPLAVVHLQSGDRAAGNGCGTALLDRQRHYVGVELDAASAKFRDGNLYPHRKRAQRDVLVGRHRPDRRDGVGGSHLWQKRAGEYRSCIRPVRLQRERISPFRIGIPGTAALV